MIKKLDDQDILLFTVGDEIGKAFSTYLDETIALTLQARYNQGKLIFEVVSFFFGVGEAKAFLTTGKITSKTLTSIKNLPKAYAKFIEGLKVTGELLKVTIKRIDDTVSAIMVNGQEIARMTKEKLIILERAFLESIDDNLQPVGQLVTPDGMFVQMQIQDGNTLKDISDRVFDIMKDTQGKYKTAVGKINNAGGEVFKEILIDIPKAINKKLPHITSTEMVTKNGTTFRLTGVHSDLAKADVYIVTKQGKTIVSRTKTTDYVVDIQKIDDGLEGVYTGKVVIKDLKGNVIVTKSGNGGVSTFFPNEWSKSKIASEVEFAI
ncbi:hypothetical protein GCM10022393_42680 [Aquimarina addita]|uniref:Bacterial EndoU nuclease domain-containing protein n=1 Tax=Aquimarina addita TaxID=870485 RepID=A0ABP6UZ50_9FLAO